MTGQHGEASAHDVVNLGEDALEGELDIGRLQGGGLDKGQALLLAKLLRVVRVHAPQVPAGSGLSKVSACRHPRESIPAAKPRPAPDLVRNIRCFEPLSLLTACRQCAKRATYKVQAEQPGGLTTATLASNSSTSRNPPQITLVSDQHDDDVGVCVVAQLLQPPLDVFKCHCMPSNIH